jgi:hypothetical protein
MMPPSLSCARIIRETGGGKYVLPAEFAGRVPVLALKRVRQIYLAKSGLQILLVQTLDAVKVQFERFADRLRQHRDSVLLAFAIAHNDFAARKVDVLNAQPHGLHQTQTRSIKQACD